MELKDILAKCDHTLLTQTATWAEIKGCLLYTSPSPRDA